MDGNPPPDITWIHEDTERVVGTNPNLTLRVDHNIAGRYYCKAAVMGFAEIGAEATIFLKGRFLVIFCHERTGSATCYSAHELN